MPHTGFAPGQTYGLLIAVAVAMLIAVMRNRQPRKLRIEALWIRPLIFLALLATTAVAAPPPLTAVSLTLMIAAAGIGAALGWQRGRFIKIEVDAETHALTSRASPIGVVFILVLLVMRVALRGALIQNAAALRVSAIAAAEAVLVLAVSMMVVQGFEMWLRARRLLEAARAVKAETSAAAISSPRTPPAVS